MSFNTENNSEENELPSELIDLYSYNEYIPYQDQLFNFQSNFNYEFKGFETSIFGKIKIIPNIPSFTSGKKVNKKKNIHDKFKTDNMFIKVNGHFISFIIDYVNSILDILDYDEKFIKINYKYKEKISIEYFSTLKNSNIGEILIQDVSPKFKLQSKNNNKIIFEKLISNPIISKLFSENYLDLFKNIYYKSERNINLDKYGLNIIVNLSKNKVKMYKDLLEKKNNKQSPEYITKLNQFVKERFINNL